MTSLVYNTSLAPSFDIAQFWLFLDFCSIVSVYSAIYLNKGNCSSYRAFVGLNAHSVISARISGSRFLITILDLTWRSAVNGFAERASEPLHPTN